MIELHVSLHICSHFSTMILPTKNNIPPTLNTTTKLCWLSSIYLMSFRKGDYPFIPLKLYRSIAVHISLPLWDFNLHISVSWWSTPPNIIKLGEKYQVIIKSSPKMLNEYLMIWFPYHQVDLSSQKIPLLKTEDSPIFHSHWAASNLAPRQPCLAAWSSGTGFAGIAGYAWALAFGAADTCFQAGADGWRARGVELKMGVPSVFMGKSTISMANFNR